MKDEMAKEPALAGPSVRVQVHARRSEDPGQGTEEITSIPELPLHHAAQRWRQCLSLDDAHECAAEAFIREEHQHVVPIQLFSLAKGKVALARTYPRQCDIPAFDGIANEFKRHRIWKAKLWGVLAGNYALSAVAEMAFKREAWVCKRLGRTAARETDHGTPHI